MIFIGLWITSVMPNQLILPFIISFVFDHLTQYATEILYSITTYLTENSLAFTLFFNCANLITHNPENLLLSIN